MISSQELPLIPRFVWAKVWAKKGEVMPKFTDKFIATLKNDGRYTSDTDTGFQIKVEKGRKYFVYRYKLNNKRYDLTLGSYPKLSLREARQRYTDSRATILHGDIPTAHWKKKLISERPTPLFKDFSLKCIEIKKSEWSNEKHLSQWYKTLETYVYPIIGDKNVNEITTEDVLRILQPYWNTKTETMTRVRQRIEYILGSATTRGLRAGANPALWKNHLETILPKPSRVTPVIHQKALPYKEIPDFMSRLRDKDSISALALEFTILTACRSSEIRLAHKSEIKDGVWAIPATRMKSRKEHKIPLSQRCLDIIAVASDCSEDSPYLFSKTGECLSDSSMLKILKVMKVNCVVHGFRSSFRDWGSEETNHSAEVLEKCLAHDVGNKVEKAYRRGNLLQARRLVMNDWEHFCSGRPIITTRLNKVA